MRNVYRSKELARKAWLGKDWEFQRRYFTGNKSACICKEPDEKHYFIVTHPECVEYRWNKEHFVEYLKCSSLVHKVLVSMQNQDVNWNWVVDKIEVGWFENEFQADQFIEQQLKVRGLKKNVNVFKEGPCNTPHSIELRLYYKALSKKFIP